MKLLFGLILSVFVTGAFAGDDAVQSVADRVSCADIQNQITELGTIEDADEEVTAELAKLKADYRRSCSKSARGRRSSTSVRAVVETETPDEVAEDADASVEIEEGVAEVVAEDAPQVELDPVAQAEKELANLDAGLCADGTKPNKYGCCTDEVFKDLGDTVFACCPKSGDGDCFPPLK